MKEYHLRPWELDELTPGECIFMMLALREEKDNSFSVSAGQDTTAFQQRLDGILEKQRAYAKLTPKEKLDQAYIQYG